MGGSWIVSIVMKMNLNGTERCNQNGTINPIHPHFETKPTVKKAEKRSKMREKTSFVSGLLFLVQFLFLNDYRTRISLTYLQ